MMDDPPAVRADEVALAEGKWMLDEATDAQVIAESAAEPERFAVIFDRYFSDIHRYAAARLGHAAADDIAAETFLAAFDQRGRYDQTRPQARAWLYGIATHLIGRHRRSQVRMHHAFERYPVAPTDAGHADRVADRVSAERMQPQLTAALAGLSPGDRDVLLLVAFGQLSYDEVAIALDIPAGTVGSRLNRARSSLRRQLEVFAPALEVRSHG